MRIGDFAGKSSFNCVPSGDVTRLGFRFRYHGSNNKTSKNPGPEGPALGHPGGVICVITFSSRV